MNQITEKDWQNTVIETAKTFGWEFIYHTFDSRHSPAGFPDLILLRGGRMVVAELKKEGGKLSAEQYFWLCEFAQVTPDTYLWMPDDFDEVVRTLQELEEEE